MIRHTTDKLLEEAQKILIIDTHEHIYDQRFIQGISWNLFKYLKYSVFLKSDLMSSGMPEREWENEEISDEEGWIKIRPFLSNITSTSYFLTTYRAIQELFDFHYSTIDDGNWKELSEKIKISLKRADWYRFVLIEKAGFKVSFIDNETADVDREFFIPMLHVDEFMFGYRKDVAESIEKKWNLSINALDDLLEGLERAFKNYKELNIICIKTLISKFRTMKVDKVNKKEAEELFQRRESNLTPDEMKKIEDFVFRTIIEKTIEYGFPLQIHTGQHRTMLWDAHPKHLNNLILEYPEARFVILHGGVPFTRGPGTLAKIHPNTVIDFCWIQMLSNAMARSAISEWLDLVPNNKLMWGGDSLLAETACGQSMFIRKILPEVLAEKVEKGYIGFSEATQILKKILHDNARNYYNLNI
jgi:predicted TIM-barrel fold metal-dependent hydrolase